MLNKVIASLQFNLDNCAPALRGKIGGFDRTPTLHAVGSIVAADLTS